MQYPSGLHWILTPIIVASLTLLALTMFAFPLNYLISSIPSLIILTYYITNDTQRAKAEQGSHDLGHFDTQLSEKALEELTRELAKTRQF